MNFKTQFISIPIKTIATVALLIHSIVALSTEADTLRNIQLEDVFVSGIKHEQRYWKSSVAATTVSQKAMTGLQINEMKDFTAIIPNFFMIDRDSKLTSSVFVRGVGTLISTPGVAMYVDGVPHFEKSSFDINLTEIDRVEFLRGPQGTLYGRNAMGGIIHVYTKSPLRHQGTKWRLRGAKYGDAYLMFSHLGRISDKLGYSVAANASNYDGYIQNATLNRKADHAQTASVNTKIEWIAAPQLSFRLLNGLDYTRQGAFGYGTYNYQENESVSNAQHIANVEQDHAGSYNRKLYDGSLQTDYYNQWFWLRSQTSVQLLNDAYDIDQDLSPKFQYVVRTADKQRLYSQELNLRSLYSERYRWHLGMFAFRQHINRNTDITTPNAINHKFHGITNSGFAVYHQSDVSLTQKLTLEAGIRYDWERMSLDYHEHTTSSQNAPPGTPFTVEMSSAFNIWSPKVALNLQLSNHYQLYASVSKGYKTGGFNQIIKKDQDDTNRFLPESSWNYEMGGKFLVAQQKLQVEWALFYIDIRNQQVRQAVSTGGSQIMSAAKSRNFGAEFSFHSQLSPSFSVSGTYGYTNAKFVEYVRDAAQHIRFDGNYTPFVPRHTFSTHAQYIVRPKTTRWYDNLTLALNYNGISNLYWNEDNQLRQPFYGLLGASITAKRKWMTLGIWANNLTNESYTAYLFRDSKGYYARKGRPMTIGATLTIEI